MKVCPVHSVQYHGDKCHLCKIDILEKEVAELRFWIEKIINGDFSSEYELTKEPLLEEEIFQCLREKYPTAHIVGKSSIKLKFADSPNNRAVLKRGP